MLSSNTIIYWNPDVMVQTQSLSISLDHADCPAISTELRPILSPVTNEEVNDSWHRQRPSSSFELSREGSGLQGSPNGEFRLPPTSDGAERVAVHESVKMAVARQTALGPFSRRPLARAARDTGFAIIPLYFLVFAILTSKQHDQPKDADLSSKLLALAKYVSLD